MAAEQQPRGIDVSRFRVERLQPNDYAKQFEARTEQMGQLAKRFAEIANEFGYSTVDANLYGKAGELDGSFKLHKDPETGTIEVNLFEEGIAEKLTIPEGAVVYKVEDELPIGESATVWYQVKQGADPLVKDRKNVKAGQQVLWFYKSKNNQWGHKVYENGALTYLVEDGTRVENGMLLCYVVPNQTTIDDTERT